MVKEHMGSKTNTRIFGLERKRKVKDKTVVASNQQEKQQKRTFSLVYNKKNIRRISMIFLAANRTSIAGMPAHIQHIHIICVVGFTDLMLR
jgi:hypothetical protein